MTGPSVKTGPTKAIVAGLGATLTALTTALATVSLAVGDDAIDASEVGSLASAIVSLIVTIGAVWRVPNKPVSS
jgi:hypothetical protein